MGTDFEQFKKALYDTVQKHTNSILDSRKTKKSEFVHNIKVAFNLEDPKAAAYFLERAISLIPKEDKAKIDYDWIQTILRNIELNGLFSVMAELST